MTSEDDAIRLKNCPAPILEELSQAPTIGLTARTRALHYSRQVEPASLVLAATDQITLPTAGLSIDPRRLGEIHAHHGRIELDFKPRTTRLELTPPPDLLQDIVLSHTAGLTPGSHLLSRRRAARQSFIPCPCCRDAAAQRRAHPEHHPLFSILSSSPQVQLHIPGPSCSISHPFHLHNLSAAKGKICMAAEDGTRLTIDAGFIHCLLIQPIRTDAESRSALMIFDMLGEQILVVSTDQPNDLRRWQQICTLKHP